MLEGLSDRRCSCASFFARRRRRYDVAVKICLKILFPDSIRTSSLPGKFTGTQVARVDCIPDMVMGDVEPCSGFFDREHINLASAPARIECPIRFAGIDARQAFLGSRAKIRESFLSRTACQQSRDVTHLIAGVILTLPSSGNLIGPANCYSMIERGKSNLQKVKQH